MLTLGIHDGHTATAALLEDGKVLACVSEERLLREKEWNGFPVLSIKECLRIAGKSFDQIDAVGVCSLMPQIGGEGWKNPPWYKRVFGAAATVLPKSVLQNPKNAARVKAIAPKLIKTRNKKMIANIEALGISADKIKFYEHHSCHAASTYYKSWYNDKKTLVITLDGSGDAVCATINIGENGKLTRISETFNYNSICDFYTYVTTFLGMKPMAHEYKVMGMAPFASEYGRQEVVDVFKSYYKIDPKNPLQFINESGAWKWQFYKRLQKDIGFARFDIVAGAVQELFEHVVVQWIQNAIAETGIHDIALSGGGFMNVKVNDKILKLPEVNSLFIMPGCGDESNPVGAGVLAAIDAGFPAKDIPTLGMIDWGASYTNDDVKAAIDKMLKGTDYKIKKYADVNSALAKRIADGKVVGRMKGRMEWGARSLGHRSILADARNGHVIHKINKAIKMRDFWMPFAPAILSEYRDEYLELRPDFKCPYMTVAPKTKERAWTDIPAGTHPFDRTARCQIVDTEHHADFHDLLSKFEKMTGVGGMLNTSFNLHGDAIVMTAEDAIYTFLNSGLDVIQMEDYLVEK
jgi:carbamoyltransferase